MNGASETSETNDPPSDSAAKSPCPEPARPIVTYDVRPDHVAIVTIDDPDATLNTLGPRFGRELTSALSTLRADRNVLAIVVRSGKPDSFVVGANISFLRTIRIAKEAQGLATVWRGGKASRLYAALTAHWKTKKTERALTQLALAALGDESAAQLGGTALVTGVSAS